MGKKLTKKEILDRLRELNLISNEESDEEISLEDIELTDEEIDRLEAMGLSELVERMRQEKEDVVIYGESKEMPMIPLRGIALAPCMLQSFDIGRERSVESFEAAMLEDERIF